MTDTTATSRAEQADKEDLREHLLTNLGEALTRLHVVLADLVVLQSHHDDDLLAGGAVDDIAHHLHAAARSIRAGYAVTLAAIEGQVVPTTQGPVLRVVAVNPHALRSDSSTAAL